MQIGIIAAMEEELKEIRSRLENQEEIHYGQFYYYTGRLCGHDVVVLLCGIGKVNAAVGTTLLLDKFKPEYIINTGVAGGFPDLLKIGDIVVSTEVRHHDADATIFDYEYGQIPRMPVAYQADKTLVNLTSKSLTGEGSPRIVQGEIMSGDSFIYHPEQIQQIRERFPSVLAVEMEGAAIAQTCYLFDIPFVIIRSISDIVSVEQSEEDYKKFLTKAAENSVALVINLLNKLQEISIER
ncbi:MAG: 5'-methylthioadenosine/adenosylhomocysteine nucleosidase [Anaerolineae bacterium]|jgi:adenosylhomocysteine nucleosidase|nr:5'-methylthioadenosine/adenosylhomocysteine nucleosidase [Anaerolineae bacterium]MBT7484102.1 5'-methylthioadenosine/adenosylhomocysteine nucleosidase [Candidatus Peregrinibacteria bacterium]MBT4308836.1 5'-methylthioadenosine/adenosylhomocysteine nucleosidase [Anaerolineae bacterium]MBT4456699.1 5'-methylthioadenosine/adenosylhomocysteine nucleosidase [Anaerolineae bacterium]MBT6062087.1 5'-methylthioadenosine/adenosylhomocysteine nucleosidase [Anaerolineae bacterium]